MWKEVASAFFRNSCFVLHRRSQMHLKLAWRQVNDDTVFILGWTTPLTLLREDVCFLWTFQAPDKTPDKMQMYCLSLLWGLIAVWVTKGGAGKNRGPAFCICIRKPHPKDSFPSPCCLAFCSLPKSDCYFCRKKPPNSCITATLKRARNVAELWHFERILLGNSSQYMLLVWQSYKLQGTEYACWCIILVCLLWCFWMA